MSTDLPEMAVIRGILIAKYSGVYGKDFALEASSELTCRRVPPAVHGHAGLGGGGCAF